MSYMLPILHIWRVKMILSAIYFSIFIPLSIQGAYAAPIDVNKPLFVKAAVDSARMNPKETILGWMQKFDSYFFDVFLSKFLKY